MKYVGDLAPVMWGRVARMWTMADAARQDGASEVAADLDQRADDLAKALLELGHQPPGDGN